ncbi:MAG TPA: LLM class F420-dependent oxidoreductase [Anaerolineales bacterium]
MKTGLQIPNFTWPGGPAVIRSKLMEIAGAAEQAGLDSLWVMDHLFQIRGVGPVEAEMLESYSTLGYLAGITRRVRLGTLVTGVIYRNPGLLVKAVTTLDVLSGGRAYLGIGAAWFEREAQALGFAFPPIKERFERLEETLQIARQMWSEDNGPYRGKHFQLAETLCSPQPISKPHPPILIGGMGEHKTLRLVAQYADACNLFARIGLDTIRTKLDVLRRHCDKLHRDYDEIERTALSSVHIAPGQQSAKEVIDLCSALASAGIQHCIFNMPNVHEIVPLEIFAREIVPAIQQF